jgi:uncharacterized protein (TIGR00251 family)
MFYLSQMADRRLLLHLYVQPRGAKSKIVGLFDGSLKLTIKAPPVEGRANEELLHFLADFLNLPLRHLTLVAGAKGRKKQVAVTGLSAAEVHDKLRPFLSAAEEQT